MQSAARRSRRVRSAALASHAEAGATNFSDRSYGHGSRKTDKLLPLDFCPAVPLPQPPQRGGAFFAQAHYSSPGRRTLSVVGFTRCTSAQMGSVSAWAAFSLLLRSPLRPRTRPTPLSRTSVSACNAAMTDAEEEEKPPQVLGRAAPRSDRCLNERDGHARRARRIVVTSEARSIMRRLGLARSP